MTGELSKGKMSMLLINMLQNVVDLQELALKSLGRSAEEGDVVSINAFGASG